MRREKINGSLAAVFRKESGNKTGKGRAVRCTRGTDIKCASSGELFDQAHFIGRHQALDIEQDQHAFAIR
jgi:hypothetical protein